MQNTHITPREPEEWTKQLQEVSKQIYPILEWHDEVMQSITKTIEDIPILPNLIEQIQDQINIFVFSLLAPFILPIIDQVKTELATGSSEIIESSRQKQHIVFSDDRSSDPTHSMLSKDHFSNILNEPAGKVASQVLKWVVPQLIACWDDERMDADRTLTRIVIGVFHHPALRNYGDDGAADGRRLMFNIVQQWWEQKDESERDGMRDQLSREGVEQGRNHKEGVHDKGHGCGKPLGMPTSRTAGSSGAIGGLPPGAARQADDLGKLAGKAVGGGALGGIVGGLVGGVGGGLLAGSFDGPDAETQVREQQRYESDGSRTQTYTETGRTRPHSGQQRYGQAEYSHTDLAGGGYREQVQRYEQEGQYGRSGFGEQVIRESRPTHGGGYEQTTETRHQRPGGDWESEVRREGRGPSGESHEERKHRKGHGGEENDSDDDDDDDDYRKKEKKNKHKKKHHDDDDEDDSNNDEEKRRGHGQRSSGYGQESRGQHEGGSGYESRQSYGEERHEFGQGHGSQERRGYGEVREDRLAYGSERVEGGNRQERYGGGRRAAYGEERPEYGNTRSGGFGEREEGYSRREEYGRGDESGEQGGYGGREQGYGGREEGYEGREEGYGRGEEDRGERGYGSSRGYGEGDDYQERRGYGNDY